MAHIITAYDPLDHAGHDPVAKLTRSAFSPLNRIIYDALGVTEECYMGASGNGNWLVFDVIELEVAQSYLEKVDPADANRPVNMADRLFSKVKKSGLLAAAEQAENPTLKPEQDFLRACLNYTRRHMLENIGVSFE